MNAKLLAERPAALLYCEILFPSGVVTTDSKGGWYIKALLPGRREPGRHLMF
jgi:hypothetical protein